MIALIDDNEVIEKIATQLRSVADAPLRSGQPVSLRSALRHLDLWPENSLPARAPPEPIIQDYVIEPVLDDLPFCDEAIAG